jgi:invasion protein IalB
MQLPKLLALAGVLAATQGALGQEVVLGGDNAAPQASSNWATRCVATSRQDGSDCTIDERAVQQSTGQLVGSVTVRVPGPGKPPLILVTAPLGLYIPAGVSVDIDGAGAQKIDIQTCDRGGCYASGTLSDALLSAMRAGKTLDIVIQDVGKQTVKLPIPLAGFPAAYDKIK